MKPLNNDNPGCNPISSNCVIWQGPDIPCIKLCKGDTVSDTVYKLATELCSILEQLDITTYDLSCLNLTECAPKDFHALIQLLIQKICDLNECCANTGENIRTSICPDECIVPVCKDFVTQDPYGNLVTTMALKDYVIAIGNRVCTIIAQINTINNALQDLDIRVTYIEENCCNQPTPALPSVLSSCIGTPGNLYVLDDFVKQLELAFCELRTATGTATEIYLAISKECAGLDGEAQLSGSGTMSSIPGWVNIANYGTAADAINNIWLTICDMRNAIKYIQDNCCPTACSEFLLTTSVTYDGTVLTIYFTGTIPLGFNSCAALGTLITITDSSANVYTQYVNIPAVINGGGIAITIATTALNPASPTYTITGSVCITDGTSQCVSGINYIVNNESNCPTLELTSTTSNVTYQFVGIAGTTYTIYLRNTCDQGSYVLYNTHSPVVTGTITGTFTPLPSGTNYIVQVKVNDTYCPCLPVITEPGVCNPPTDPTSEINIIL